MAFVSRLTGPSPVTVETDIESAFRDITDQPSVYAIIFQSDFRISVGPLYSIRSRLLASCFAFLHRVRRSFVVKEGKEPQRGLHNPGTSRAWAAFRGWVRERLSRHSKVREASPGISPPSNGNTPCNPSFPSSKFGTPRNTVLIV